jgi:3-phenylpropionate/trans-cinnamate dioxygenase ferredoxin reductase subunit
MPGAMVIVGAGECGARAAFALREAGHDGPVTLIGDEEHPPYERPPLSKEAITAAADPAPRLVRAREAYAAAGITLMTGAVAAGIDRKAKVVALAGGGAVPYDRLLLATGAVPRRLPGAEGPRTALLRTFEDAVRIRAAAGPGCRAVIVGGGLIGLELAASLTTRGAAVTVVEALPRILSRGVPEAIAAVIAERHRTAGVDLLCGQGIAGFDDDGASTRVRLADGRELRADLLVVGIGVTPATRLAEAAGLPVDNGIAVDETLATADGAIFAAGDCCSFPLACANGRRVRLECWRSAQDQGALAARNMLGAAEPASAVPWFWSDQYDLTMQAAGLPDPGAAIVRRDLDEGAFILFHLEDDGRLAAAAGIGRGNAVARDIRLAELLIAKGARPAPAQLASPDIRLKSLLTA